MNVGLLDCNPVWTQQHADVTTLCRYGVRISDGRLFAVRCCPQALQANYGVYCRPQPVVSKSS